MSADQIEWLHSLVQELENAKIDLPMGDYGYVYEILESIRERYMLGTENIYCDDCGTTYALGADDHCGEEGTCWGCCTCEVTA